MSRTAHFEEGAGYLGLPNHAWNHIAKVRDALEQNPSSKVCYQATSYLSKKLGWEQHSGYFTGGGHHEGHYWNVAPSGHIVDPTYDQFDDSGDPVRVVPPGHPAQAEYRRTT